MNENNENTNVVPTENVQEANQNNINNNNAETYNKIPQSVSTVAPSPQVATEPQIDLQQPKVEPQTPNNEPEKKEGTFKYILAFIFIIAFTGFVIFIPEISKFVKSKIGEKNSNNTEKLIEKGTLICEKDKSSDETDVKYTLKYIFDNKKLLTSSYETTYESLNAELLNQKSEECKLIMETSKNIRGIETSCNDKNGILKINEEYTNQDIDSSHLTAYTEAGGTYPEFKYGQNVYDIQTTLVKQGYDCNVSSIQE